MCGIWAVLGEVLPPEAAKKYIQQLVPRGPEGTRILAIHSGGLQADIRNKSHQ